MNIFWSWQADTDGKTGRHFVREALTEAIKQLKEPSDVEEPHERDLRESIHLDHDRKDVSGTPSIADVIFDKIDHADVFVADVTPVASLTRLQPTPGEPAEKKLINSNVAIEYGYAVRAVTDELILLVQNTHYGNREDLPFDLKHKGSPIQYKLASGASKAELKFEQAKLVGMLVVALRACFTTLARSGPTAPKFEEIPPTTNRAYFWQKGELLAQYGFPNPLGIMRSKDGDVVEYRFDEQRALYVRLIPTVPRHEIFTFGKLMSVIELRRVRVMTRTMGGGLAYANKYGAVYYEPSGTNTTPVALTQLHRNGEIWAVTREHWAPYAGEDVVVMGNVENRIRECLENSIQVARNELDIEPPFQVEIGIIGLKDMRLSRPRGRPSEYTNQLSDRVHDPEWHIRRVLNDANPAAQDAVVKDFLRGVFALVGIDL